MNFEFLQLIIGDDAKKVRWMDLSAELQLYASHSDFLKRVALMHKAHWLVFL